MPSRRATAWAHLNDAVTALGTLPPSATSPVSRIAAGTRGGCVSVYKSRDHGHIEFEEMCLGTMRATAFLEAEACGATGAGAAREPHFLVEGRPSPEVA